MSCGHPYIFHLLLRICPILLQDDPMTTLLSLNFQNLSDLPETSKNMLHNQQNSITASLSFHENLEPRSKICKTRSSFQSSTRKAWKNSSPYTLSSLKVGDVSSRYLRPCHLNHSNYYPPNNFFLYSVIIQKAKNIDVIDKFMILG